MHRRPVVLLTPPRATSTSSLFRTFCTVLQKCEGHLFPLQPLPASLQKPRGCHKERLSNPCSPLATRDSPLTPLSATLTADLRVGFQGLYLQTLTEQPTEISRNRQLANPLDATLTRSTSVTPLSATLTRNRGR